MIPQHQTARLWLETSGTRYKSLGEWKLRPYHQGLEEVVSVRSTESFGYLTLEVDGTNGSGPHILLNGRTAQLRRVGGVWQTRTELKTDLAFMRIAIIGQSSTALTLDLAVEHRYLRSNEWVVKWPVAQFEKELEKYEPLFASSEQSSVNADRLSTGALLSGDIDGKRLLPQIIGRIESHIQGTSDAAILEDFFIERAGGIDRNAVLTGLKRNPRLLTPSDSGSIGINGRRYTTSLNSRSLSHSAQIDFGEITSLLAACASIARTSDLPISIYAMLQRLVSSLSGRFQGQQDDREDFDKVIVRPMHSLFGLQLQDLLRLLVSVLLREIARTQSQDRLMWLKRSVLDRDVFQTSVFACCAKALGFSDHEITASSGVLRGPDRTVVADANRADGLAVFRDSTNSWRQQTIQPSDYRPDTFILLRGVPILIDAKFRLPDSAALVANSDGLKDVQAYMDDFGLCSSIVVVPRLLSSTDGMAIIRGKKKSIFVVALQDSDDCETQALLRASVLAVADTCFPTDKVT